MPLYSFIREEDGKIEDVFFHMDDKKIYNGKDGKEIGKWKRIWLKPRMSVDSIAIDPYSSNDFNRVTNKGGKLGDLWDRSEELSQKRVDRDGIDPVKQTFYEKYKKTHKGNSHPQEKKEKSKKQLDDMGISVKFE